MRELRPSNDLLGDAIALRRQLDDEGYVFLRDVLDTDLVANVKAGVMAWFASHDLLTVADGEPVWTGRDFTALGGDPRELFETGLCETLALSPDMRRVYEQVLGEPVFVLPLGHYQFRSRSNSRAWRVHQDGPFSPGLDYVVFWVPLMEIPEELGGVTIAPHVHKRGSLYPDHAPATTTLPAATIAGDSWYRADYRPGDVLVFGLLTPHCGLENETDRVRLSIDIRVQPSSSPRALIGVVTDTDDHRITIAAEDGEKVVLDIDEQAVLWTGLYDGDRSDPSAFLGLRVIATVGPERTAQLVRGLRGYVPWQQ
jgi:ectoine hydroxylase-related dioxygenase (phytanoyl-CoA dioxygenase family)